MGRQIKYGHLLHGGDYNPEQWLDRPDILEKDIEYFKKAKINTVSVGMFSYEPANHQEMVRTRAAKVAAVADDLPRQEVMGAAEGDLLVIGWGGTRGNVQSAVEQLQEEGKRISLCHFNYIHPLPHGVREILGGFRRIVVCELNEGQLASYLRQQFQEFRFGQYNKCEGLPFTVVELKEEFNRILNEK